jgi:hypothetical protein
MLHAQMLLVMKVQRRATITIRSVQDRCWRAT